MGFETPNFNQEGPKTNESSEPSKLKKVAGLVALGAMAAGVVGCDNGEKGPQGGVSEKGGTEIKRVETGGGLRAQHEIGQKALGETMTKIFAHEADIKAGKITKDNIENDPFLQSYYEYVDKQGNVPDGGNQMVKQSNERIFTEGAMMRALWHAWLNGQEIDLSKGLTMGNSKFVGNVLVSADLNGVNITISEDDFTPREKEILELVRGGKGEAGKTSAVEQGGGQNVSGKFIPKGQGGVRQGPDFDKDVDF